MIAKSIKQNGENFLSVYTFTYNEFFIAKTLRAFAKTGSEAPPGLPEERESNTQAKQGVSIIPAFSSHCFINFLLIILPSPCKVIKYKPFGKADRLKRVLF